MSSFRNEKSKQLPRLCYKRVEFFSSPLRICFGQQNNPFAESKHLTNVSRVISHGRNSHGRSNLCFPGKEP